MKRHSAVGDARSPSPGRLQLMQQSLPDRLGVQLQQPWLGHRRLHATGSVAQQLQSAHRLSHSSSLTRTRTWVSSFWSPSSWLRACCASGSSGTRRGCRRQCSSRETSQTAPAQRTCRWELGSVGRVHGRGIQLGHKRSELPTQATNSNASSRHPAGWLVEQSFSTPTPNPDAQHT